MIPVKPNSKTTLILSAAFQPVGFISARDAIRNMMVGAVKAYDQHGNIHDWGAWISADNLLDPDHPALRSVDTDWAIPTIVVIPGYFGNWGNGRRGAKRRRTVSLRQLYNIYGGTCQYCHRDIPYSQATRDHVLPRSRGGGNHDSNIVLSCKRCNLRKGSKFPYFDIKGAEVKAKILNSLDFVALSEKVNMRPEWETFLGKR